MHEMALAEGMIEIVEATARGNAASRVRTVWLELGALSHVAPDALRFCFDAVTRGGIAEGAELQIITVPGRAWCLPCEAEIALTQIGDPCPECGSYQLQVTAGEDMRLREIAVA